MSEWCRPDRPSRNCAMKCARFMCFSQNFAHGRFEGEPFGDLCFQRQRAAFCDLVIFARRAAAGFLQIGRDQPVILHPAHQGIDGAFAHAHRLGHAAGDVIGVVVAFGEQRQHAHLQHAFLQLDLQGLRHGYCLSHGTLSCKVLFRITRPLRLWRLKRGHEPDQPRKNQADQPGGAHPEGAPGPAAREQARRQHHL